MKHAGPLIAILLLAACSLESAVSETDVPGTDLKFVLVEDEKGMRRYHMYLNGEEVSEPGFLGSHDADAPRMPEISRVEDEVTLRWRGSLNTQFVTLNVPACRITQQSNPYARPPTLERCRA